MDEVTFVVRVSARSEIGSPSWVTNMQRSMAESYAEQLRNDLRAFLRAREEVSGITVETVGVIVRKAD